MRVRLLSLEPSEQGARLHPSEQACDAFSSVLEHVTSSAVVTLDDACLDMAPVPTNSYQNATANVYSALFPVDPAAFSCANDVPTDKDDQCFLIQFHIRPESVEAFKLLLIEECVAVLVSEPGMLRYDFYQSTDDPCMFIVMELLADEAALAMHENRRADGTMRAALATMEATPRKDFAMTGRYSVRSGAARLRWPAVWREAATLRCLCSSSFFDPPPSFIESAQITTKVVHAALHATLGRRPCEWLSRVFGTQVERVSRLDHRKLGGLSSRFGFFHIEFAGNAAPIDVALKTVPEANLPRSRTLGNAREGQRTPGWPLDRMAAVLLLTCALASLCMATGLFYQHLASMLKDAGVLHAHAAFGCMKSGESLVLMACCRGAVPSGVHFGPGNPNNWGVALPAAGCGLDVQSLSAEIFRLYARLHAAHWNATDGLRLMPWLRGADWADGCGQATWEAAMAMAADAWVALGTARRDGTTAIEWDPHLVACLDVSFAKAVWVNFLAEQAARPLTLVHGDCHPHNVLLLPEASGDAGKGNAGKGNGADLRRRLRLIDFEMVGVGSGPQELGQFIISHMEPALRRATEHGLVCTYHAELTASLRANGLEAEAEGYTLEACWKEYVAGGVGRWAWFVAYLAHAMPNLGQFFHDQLAAFLHDHVSDPAQAPMPRV